MMLHIDDTKCMKVMHHLNMHRLANDAEDERTPVEGCSRQPQIAAPLMYHWRETGLLR